MMHYDQQNAIWQLARRCNAECRKAVHGAKPRDYTNLTLPVFTRYAALASSIGVSITMLKYHVAILNKVIEPR
jgi:hypothetical protein